MLFLALPEQRYHVCKINFAARIREYAEQNKMAYVLIKNKDGNFVAPDDLNFKAAAANADWNKTFYQVLTEQPGKDAWPLTGATFILMHKSQAKAEQAATSLKFFDWAYASGDKMAMDLEYVALHDSLKRVLRPLIMSRDL